MIVIAVDKVIPATVMVLEVNCVLNATAVWSVKVKALGVVSPVVVVKLLARLPLAKFHEQGEIGNCFSPPSPEMSS